MFRIDVQISSGMGGKGAPMTPAVVATPCGWGISLRTDDLVGAMRLVRLNPCIVGISVVSDDPALDGASVWPENHVGPCEAFSPEFRQFIADVLRVEV